MDVFLLIMLKCSFYVVQARRMFQVSMSSVINSPTQEGYVNHAVMPSSRLTRGHILVELDSSIITSD